MKFTDKEYLNKTLAIIDACQTEALINFSFNLPSEFYDLKNPDNIKGLSIKKFVDKDFKLMLTKQNKKELITTLAANFDEGDICHYTFYHRNSKIGEGFDNCEINFLDPEYFALSEEHKSILTDEGIIFKQF